MFLGGRVDDAISTYYTRILEHDEQLTTDHVKDAYRDHWQRELAAEQDKLGIQWDPGLGEAGVFEMGLQAIELTLAELVPKLGQPVAVQRKLEFPLVPGLGLEWTIHCYLDLETLRPDEHGELHLAIVDYKIKGSPLSQQKADHDPQAGLYLAGRWLEGAPPGILVCPDSQTRLAAQADERQPDHHPAQRRAAARHARPVRARSQPDRRPERAVRSRPAVGVRGPERLEVQPALLLALHVLSGRRRAVARGIRSAGRYLPRSGANRSRGRPNERRQR
jgi:hypothetical protein